LGPDALTENLNFSQTFCFYTLLVGYYLIFTRISHRWNKILQMITC